MTPEQCLKKGAECEQRARTTTDLAARNTLLQAAAEWRKLAEIVRGKGS